MNPYIVYITILAQINTTVNSSIFDIMLITLLVGYINRWHRVSNWILICLQKANKQMGEGHPSKFSPCCSERITIPFKIVQSANPVKAKGTIAYDQDIPLFAQGF